MNYFAWAITSKAKSTDTSLCKRITALYFPVRLTLPPITLMNFLSIVWPSFSKAAATSMLFTDPNNLSPLPTLDAILISKAFKASANFLTFYINFSSL